MPTINLYINPSAAGSVKLEVFAVNQWLNLGTTATELHSTQNFNLFRFTVVNNLAQFVSWTRDSPTGQQLGITSPMTLTVSTIATVYANFTPPPECVTGTIEVLTYCADNVTWKTRRRCVNGSWVYESQSCPEDINKKFVVHTTADTTAAVLLASKLSGEVERWNLSSQGNPSTTLFDSNDIYIVGGPLAHTWINTVYTTYNFASKPNLCTDPYFIKSTVRSSGKVIYIIYGQTAADTLHVCESYPNCPTAPVGNVYIEIGRVGSGNVTVNGDPITSYSYMLQVESGTVLTFNATASFGWNFIRWQGDFNSTANPYTFTASTNGYFNVVFEEVPDVNVTVNRNITHGVVKVNGVDLSSYPQVFQFSIGEGVRFQAVADYGYHFVNWTGLGLTSTSNPLDVSITNTGIITGNFAVDTALCVEGSTRNVVYCNDGVTWKSRDLCSDGAWIPQTQPCPDVVDDPLGYWWIIPVIIILLLIIFLISRRRKR